MARIEFGYNSKLILEIDSENRRSWCMYTEKYPHVKLKLYHTPFSRWYEGPQRIIIKINFSIYF